MDPVCCLVPRILALLQGFLDRVTYLSMLNVYVAAISVHHSTMDGISLGAHKTVTTFLKSVRHLSLIWSLESPDWDLTVVLGPLKKCRM